MYANISSFCDDLHFVKCLEVPLKYLFSPIRKILIAQMFHERIAYCIKIACRVGTASLGWTCLGAPPRPEKRHTIASVAALELQGLYQQNCYISWTLGGSSFRPKTVSTHCLAQIAPTMTSHHPKYEHIISTKKLIRFLPRG